MTTAPTAAQADAWFNNEEFIANFISEMAGGGGTEKAYIVTFTQNDSTISGVLLNGDPTSNFEAALVVYGGVSKYTNVTVREYVFPGSAFTDVTSIGVTNFLANSTEQARVNNPSNWATAP